MYTFILPKKSSSSSTGGTGLIDYKSGGISHTRLEPLKGFTEELPGTLLHPTWDTNLQAG